MKIRVDIILLGAAVLVGVAAAWNGYQMGLVQFGKPGPGLFPLLIGVLLTLLSGIEFLRTWKGAIDFSMRGGKYQVAVNSSIFVALVVYVLAFPYFGFLASSVALVSFLLYVAGRQRLTVAIALSFALVLPVYAVFAWVLMIQFPERSIF